MKQKLHYMFALFDDFDRAKEAIVELKILDLKETVIEELELYSPIEHPDAEELLDMKPQWIQRFTFFGAITGTFLSFVFTSAVVQAMFTVQPQGGKPVIPIPTNIIIMYEGTILFGVYMTVLAFLIYAGLPHFRNKKMYSEKVTEDQLAVEVAVKPENVDRVRDLLTRLGANEIREGDA